jgi:hypothetical protein
VRWRDGSEDPTMRPNTKRRANACATLISDFLRHHYANYLRIRASTGESSRVLVYRKAAAIPAVDVRIVTAPFAERNVVIINGHRCRSPRLLGPRKIPRAGLLKFHTEVHRLRLRRGQWELNGRDVGYVRNGLAMWGSLRWVLRHFCSHLSGSRA